MFKLKHKKPTSPCNNGGTINQKTCIIPLAGGSHLSLGCWLYKFNIYNEYLTWISSKLNVKDISVSDTDELYDKRSTKNFQVSFG